MKIADITAREILDSNGNPTLEAQVALEDGVVALGGVPAGASVGQNEAFELRDNDKSRFFGKGVLKAKNNVLGPIKKALVGLDADDQQKIDKILIELDGTKDKSKLGANAILGVSMATCRASARSKKIPLYEYFGQLSENSVFGLPQPQVLLLEGGKHGRWAFDFQEFFIVPCKEAFPSFSERIRVGAEIYQKLKSLLEEKGVFSGVGFEGAFVLADAKSNEQAIELILEATTKAGYAISKQILLGIDFAASEFFLNGNYQLKKNHETFSEEEWLSRVEKLSQDYPLWSLEDPLAQNRLESWGRLYQKLGNELQIVGDDLTTTNTQKIKNAYEAGAINSVIIKPNQIGTITETIEAILFCREKGISTIISHRGGETNDDLIADLCVGTGSWQCKFGSPNRGERVAKYNRLIRIEEKLLSKRA